MFIPSFIKPLGQLTILTRMLNLQFSPYKNNLFKSLLGPGPLYNFRTICILSVLILNMLCSAFVICATYTKRSKTTHFTNCGALGMLETAPAFNVHLMFVMAK